MHQIIISCLTSHDIRFLNEEIFASWLKESSIFARLQHQLYLIIIFIVCYFLAYNTAHHAYCCRQDQGMKAPSAVSNQWGSYFVDVHKGAGSGEEDSSRLTWCCHSIHKYSTMAIPSVEHIAGGGNTHTTDEGQQLMKEGSSSACPQIASRLSTFKKGFYSYLVSILAKLFYPVSNEMREATW